MDPRESPGVEIYFQEPLCTNYAQMRGHSAPISDTHADARADAQKVLGAWSASRDQRNARLECQQLQRKDQAPAPRPGTKGKA